MQDYFFKYRLRFRQVLHFFTEKSLKQLKDRKLRLSRILGQFSPSTRAVILMGWYRSKQGSNITEFYIGLAEVLAQLGESQEGVLPESKPEGSLLPYSSETSNAFIFLQLFVCILTLPRSHGHESQPSPARLRSVLIL